MITDNNASSRGEIIEQETNNGLDTENVFAFAINNIIAEHTELTLATTPWRVSFLHSNGGERKEATKRWKDIAKQSEWVKFQARLVKKLSKDGKVFVFWNIVNGVPTLMIADRVIDYNRVYGAEYDRVIALVNYNDSLRKIKLITTTFTPNKIINNWEEEETIINKLTGKEEIKIVEKEEIIDTNYGAIPGTVIENRTGFTNSTIGSRDDLADLQHYITMLDELWQKMRDEIKFAATEIAINSEEASILSGIEEEMSELSSGEITKQLRQGVRLYTFASDNNGGKNFDIIQRVPNLGVYQEQFDSVWNDLIFLTGGIPKTDREGKVNMTDSQSSFNKNTTELIAEIKRNNIIFGLSQLIKDILPSVDKKPSIWGNIFKTEIELFITDKIKETAIFKDPANFIKAGFTPIDLIMITQKLTEAEAKSKFVELDQLVQESPFTQAILSITPSNQSNNEVDTEVNAEVGEEEQGEE